MPQTISLQQPGVNGAVVRLRTGLTLSGGGFRATLFHLGVVRFLYEEGLLPKITDICSVSGGSILAAHLVLNWERYTSKKEEDFNAVVKELIDFIRSDLRGRVVRPWLFSWAALGLPRLARGRWWRTRLLQREYDRLYKGHTLRDLVSGDRPQLHLLSTSFTTGHLVAFGNKEMRFCGDPLAGGRLPDPDFMPADDVPVALAVAASSAFPPLFPPVRVDHSTFGAPTDVFPNRHYLTDGGVFDNLGIRRLLWLFSKERLDMVVVSDAQRSLAKEYKNEYNLTLGRTARCVDLMMDRVSWFENIAAADVISRNHGRLVSCRVQDLVRNKPYAPTPAEQYAVSTARTDLDKFTNDEIDAIVHHGYSVSRNAAEESGTCKPWSEKHKVWHPASPARKSVYYLGDIDRRKPGLFRASHWASWALWGLMIFWAALPITLIIVQSVRAERERSEVERVTREAKDAREKAEAQKKQDEQTREMQIDHVAKKIKMVRLLGEVVISGNPESAKRKLNEWSKFAAELRKDPWFNAFLDSPNVAAVDEAIRKPWPFPSGTEKQVHQLAKDLRSILEESSGDVYLQVVRASRAQCYAEVGEIADTIADDKKPSLEDVPNSRKQFWRLYWGQMVLVEGPDVESAMVEFGKILRTWEETNWDATPEMKKNLQAAADSLKKACKAELAAQGFALATQIARN